jgi:hypothetical protein
MESNDSYMGFVVSSMSVLCSVGKNQHSKCGMITGYSQLLHIFLNVRYVSLFLFETYPFTLLSLVLVSLMNLTSLYSGSFPLWPL